MQPLSTFEFKSKMAELLSDSASNGIREIMDQTTSDPNKIPGCVAVVVDKSGKALFQHASGTRGADTKERMTLDSVFWIASCTKMIGGIAAMQLVEQGKLALDDADLVEKHCPELKHVKIIKGIDENGKAETVEKKNRITLRMLLNHTGKCTGWSSVKLWTVSNVMSSWLRVEHYSSVPSERQILTKIDRYTFFHDILRLNGQPVGIDELDAHSSGILEQPIMFEPGTYLNITHVLTRLTYRTFSRY